MHPPRLLDWSRGECDGSSSAQSRSPGQSSRSPVQAFRRGTSPSFGCSITSAPFTLSFGIFPTRKIAADIWRSHQPSLRQMEQRAFVQFSQRLISSTASTSTTARHSYCVSASLLYHHAETPPLLVAVLFQKTTLDKYSLLNTTLTKKHTMVNIKSLQIWDEICTDDRLTVSKSLFGLKTTATYKPTESKLDANIIGYSPSDGAKLKRIVETLHESPVKDLGDFRPKPVPNGNYQVEVCASQDGEYLAIMLYQFIHLGYEPVTGMHIFEGEKARLLKQILF